MKKAKQFLANAREPASTESDELNTALWHLIYYSSKLPLRLAQEQLKKEATKLKSPFPILISANPN